LHTFFGLFTCINNSSSPPAKNWKSIYLGSVRGIPWQQASKTPIIPTCQLEEKKIALDFIFPLLTGLEASLLQLRHGFTRLRSSSSSSSPPPHSLLYIEVVTLKALNSAWPSRNGTAPSPPNQQQNFDPPAPQLSTVYSTLFTFTPQLRLVPC